MFTKFFGGVGLGKWTNQLHFGTNKDPGSCIFSIFRIVRWTLLTFYGQSASGIWSRSANQHHFQFLKIVRYSTLTFFDQSASSRIQDLGPGNQNQFLLNCRFWGFSRCTCSNGYASGLIYVMQQKISIFGNFVFVQSQTTVKTSHIFPLCLFTIDERHANE